jgi:choline dehydrogenase-like flavoprotein
MWVADASLLEPLSVNPMFGVMAVGEKVAELILGA